MVRRESVSVPEVGSVTPKAWSRNSPLAILGSQVFFCASEPCFRTVPMVYICAWQAAALAVQAASGRPEPPYSSGIRQARYPASVSAFTKALG